MSAKKSKCAPRPVADSLASQTALRETAARLALFAPDAGAPSPRVKAALLARVRAGQPQQSNSGQRGQPEPAAPEAGWKFSSLASGAGWLRLPLPGVRMRELSIDRERDVALLFVEMQPGA